VNFVISAHGSTRWSRARRVVRVSVIDYLLGLLSTVRLFVMRRRSPEARKHIAMVLCIPQVAY
jgi:hypothetical protein